MTYLITKNYFFDKAQAQTYNHISSRGPPSRIGQKPEARSHSSEQGRAVIIIHIYFLFASAQTNIHYILHYKTHTHEDDETSTLCVADEK